MGKFPKGGLNLHVNPVSTGTSNSKENGLPGLPVSRSPPYSPELVPSD